MSTKARIEKDNKFGKHVNFWLGSIISPADSAVQEQLVSGGSWGYQYQVAIFDHYSIVDSERVERVEIAQVLLPVTAGSGAAGRLESVKLSAGDRVFGAFFGPEETIPVIISLYTRTQYTVYGTGKFQPRTGFEGDMMVINDLLERQEFSGTKLPSTPRLIKGGRSGKQIPDTSNLGPSGSTQVFGQLSDDNIA